MPCQLLWLLLSSILEMITMTDAATSAAAAQATAISMLSLAAIGQALGIDFVALFWAFMGAVVWRALQPRIAPNFDAISTAFGWAMAAMILGSLGGILASLVLVHFFPYLESASHPTIVGLPAFLLSILCSPIILKASEQIKNWRQPGA